MSSLRDFLQAIRAMIARIHRSHVREQRLGRADVAGGFFTADVLLAGAKREAQSGFAASVLGHADEASGHLTFEFIARGEECRVRAAVTERNTETLRTADRDVR